MSDIKTLQEHFFMTGRIAQAIQHSLHGIRAPVGSMILARQKKIKSIIEGTSRTYWVQDSNVQTKIIKSYLKALESLLITTHDLAAHYITLVSDERLVTDYLKRYHETIIQWLGASPFISLKHHRNPIDLLTQFKHNPAFPFSIPAQSFSKLTSSLQSMKPKKNTAKNRFRKEISKLTNQRIRQQSRKLILGEAARHALGHSYIITQFNLHARGNFTPFKTSAILEWYQGTQVSIKELNSYLNLFVLIEEKSLVEGDLEKARFFRIQDELYQRLMAQVYSVRELRVPTLFTQFYGQNKLGNRLSFVDEIIGVNGVNEKISTYFGNSNPDNLASSVDAESVDFVLALKNKFDKKEIGVIGTLRRSRNIVYSMVDKHAGIKFDPIKDLESQYITILRSNNSDRKVIVKGTFDASGSIIRNARVLKYVHNYDALCGLHLKSFISPKEQFRPLHSWRKVSKTLEVFADRELMEKSVSSTLSGQKVLSLDVHRRLHKKLIKGKKIEGLERRSFRIDVWKVIFENAQRNPSITQLESIVILFDFINRFLNLFTRHTYLNIRDDGNNYVDSKWSRDLIGQDFYDCGVYAMTQAFEIGQVLVNSKSPPAITFQFVTFLNHIFIIGYINNKYSFMINNDHVYGPKKNRKEYGNGRTMRLNVTRDWAEIAFSDVYDVRYSIIPIVLTDLLIKVSSSTKSYSSSLWTAYQNSIAWAVRNETAILYNTGIVAYDKYSALLDQIVSKNKKWKSLPKTEQEEFLNDTANLALKLYELADLLTHSCNLARLPTFTKSKKVPFVGAFDLTREKPKNLNLLLPMYRVHDLVKHKKNEKLPSLLLNKSRGKKHGNELTNQLRNGCSDGKSVATLKERWENFFKELNILNPTFEKWAK